MNPSLLAQKMAECIGLTDDSFRSLVPLVVELRELGQRGETIVPERLESFNQNLRQFYSLVGPFQDPKNVLVKTPVMTSFASRYLPSLAQAITLLPSPLVRASPWYYVLVDIGPNHPLFAYFMRNHPDAGKLQLALMEAFAATEPSMFSLKTFDDDATLWLTLGSICQGALLHLFHNRVPGPPFPWSSSTDHLVRRFKQIERHVQSIYKTEKKISPDAFVELMSTSSALVLLATALSSDGAQNPVFSVLVEDARRSVPWSRCEGSLTSQGRCGVTAQKMMMCAKCKAVAYCSKEVELETTQAPLCRTLLEVDWIPYR